MEKKTLLQKMFHKSRIYPLLLILLMIGVYKYREMTDSSKDNFQVNGVTMGTIQYTVKYIDPNRRDFSEGIKKELQKFNQSLSTYISDSEISTFNISDSLFDFKSPYFRPVAEKSKVIFEQTDGYFDPTVLPLVKGWNFGPNKTAEVKLDSLTIDSLLAFVGYQNIEITPQSISKKIKNIQLDFSAIAKGYAVDVIAEYLTEEGIHDYMVEIGGEIRCHGRNPKEKTWTIGVTDPQYHQKGKETPVSIKKVLLNNKAIATSGNYENYHTDTLGNQYVHTINPKTGEAFPSNLLSASVVANDCMTADAWATALMAMGFERSIDYLERNPHVAAYLIYSDSGVVRTAVTGNMLENFEKKKKPTEEEK